MSLFYKLYVRKCLNETTRVLTFSPQPQRSKIFLCIIPQDVPVELRVFLSFLMFWQELEVLRRVKRTSSVRRWDFRWGIISASLPDIYHYDYTIYRHTNNIQTQYFLYAKSQLQFTYSMCECAGKDGASCQMGFNLVTIRFWVISPIAQMCFKKR